MLLDYYLNEILVFKISLRQGAKLKSFYHSIKFQKLNKKVYDVLKLHQLDKYHITFFFQNQYMSDFSNSNINYDIKNITFKNMFQIISYLLDKQKNKHKKISYLPPHVDKIVLLKSNSEIFKYWSPHTLDIYINKKPKYIITKFQILKTRNTKIKKNKNNIETKSLMYKTILQYLQQINVLHNILNSQNIDDIKQQIHSNALSHTGISNEKIFETIRMLRYLKQNNMLTNLLY